MPTDLKVTSCKTEHAEYPGACHTRAIREGARRSVTVTHGHSPTGGLHPRPRRSLVGRGTDLPIWSCRFDPGRLLSCSPRRSDHRTARHRLCDRSRWPAPPPPAAPCHKRSRRTTETVLKQILRPGCHAVCPALPGSEPGRRPGPVLDGPKVTADIIEHCRDFLLGKLLDEPKQFLALHAHKLSVRSAARLTPLLSGAPVACPIGR